MLNNKKQFLAIFTGITISLSANAETNTFYGLPFAMGRTRLSADASNNLGMLNSDFLLPIYGHQKKFIFTDITAKRATDDTYFIGPGAGYRQKTNNQIFGAYFFSDYDHTRLDENFWVLNPGIEWMTPQWDAHLNGYFPTQTKQQNGHTDFASNMSIYDYVDLVDGTHIQNDAILTPYTVIGNGADFAIGYSFEQENHLRAHLRRRLLLSATRFV